MQPDGSSSAESDETFDIYFLSTGEKYYFFYRIPDDQPPPSQSGVPFLAPVSGDEKFLKPVFYRDRQNCQYPGCAAVGTTLYLFGGCIEGHYLAPILQEDVYYTDTVHPEKDWKRGKPMINPRRFCLGFCVNDQIHVAGGSPGIHDYYKRLPIDVYNPKDETWVSKCELIDEEITDSAVYDNGKQVLLFTGTSQLLVYNVENGNYGHCPRPKDYGSYPQTMTVLGETLFMASFTGQKVFQIMGFDFLNAKEGGCCPVQVTGLDSLMDNKSDYLLPEMSYVIGDFKVLWPEIKLLAIGKNKLALLWAVNAMDVYYVNCLKMEIVRQDIDNQILLNARSGSFSSHIAEGHHGVDLYIPVLKRKADSDTDIDDDDQEDN